MKQTILLADDSPTIQRLVANTFADIEFDVVSVSNGEAAIRKFEEIHPSVVLADIYMPGKNGYEVCAHIKQHPTLGHTPVVLLVGAFDAFDEEKAREAGATANITKPFEPHALIELVQSVFDAAAAEKVAPIARAEQVSEKAAEITAQESETDLLGLEALFFEPSLPVPSAGDGLKEEDIDRIADRVVQRLSTQVVEGIAWKIVPDIAEKIVREELKKSQ